MKNGEENQKEFDGETLSNSTSLSFLIAGTKVLEDLADARSFNEFLKLHSIRKRNLLPGIKLIFENIMDNVISQIETNCGFFLDTDRITRRALFRGVSIDTVRSNSSMAQLLRGLNQAKIEVCRENSIPEFHITLAEQLSPLFKAIKILFEKHTKLLPSRGRGLNKRVVLNLLCYSWYLRFLNIRRQVRVPLLDKMFEEIDELMGGFEKVPDEEIDPRYKKRGEVEEKKRKKEAEKYKKKLPGWKTSSAYLWSRVEGKFTPAAPVDSILSCASWEELDGLFRPIADNQIKEVDRILGSRYGSVFYRKSQYRPRVLKPLLVKYDESLDDDEKLILDHQFLWYDFEILDGADPKIFPGVATFTNLLVGTVFMKQYYDRKEPVEIRRILHPAGFHVFKKGEKPKFDIGYAILVPSYSTMADYSGWVVSLDCCNDYSGFSGGMHAFAEHFIEQNEDDLFIDDIVISRGNFRNYLDTKLQERHDSPYGSSLSESEWESITLKEFVELGIDMSAVVIELFMAISLAERKYEIRWQYRDRDVIGDKEIDVLAVSSNVVQIIECSRHFPINSEGVSKIVRELKRKQKLIENSAFKREKVFLRYITSKNLDNDEFKQAAEEFRKEGISAENIFDLLDKSEHRTKPIKELLSRISYLGVRINRLQRTSNSYEFEG